jgi:hypothetical protein
MNLRGRLEDDVGAVFLNLGEFAEETDYDGRKIVAVREEIRAQPVEQSNRLQERPRGVFGRGVTLWAAKADFPVLPVTGERVTLDGEPFVVRGSSDDMGMVEILLEANES